MDEIQTLKQNNKLLQDKLDKQTKVLKKQQRIQRMGERKQEELLLEIRKAKKEVESMHNHIRQSIEYASLIQRAIIPKEKEIESYFKDSFVYWEPKDTVGGDIWLFDSLRHKDECLLFFIDCTGHGVAGAFVTMIVKAIEREVITKIHKDKNVDISPAWIMSYFNKTMKILLKQEAKNSLSNVGWDGAIVYYNKRDQILKFAGAETSLFYIDENQEFKIIKGNRYSVGYKKCTMDYEYKETILNVQEGMKFYCTTDGYIDQNGGEKNFPFGKKRFSNIIKENYDKSMLEQKNIFIKEINKYEQMVSDNERNDDITLVAFEIDNKANYQKNETQEIVRYEGIITQNVIASCMDNIESKISDIGISGVVSTITIECCQNIMNYSKAIKEEDSKIIVPMGYIEVVGNDGKYNIIAKNIVSIEDKKTIEPRLKEIQSLDKSSIKKRYRELRKSGKYSHKKGGGIGMYEIARISDKIEYLFTPINEDKYYFTIKSFV